MAKLKLVLTNQKIVKKVSGCYKKIEEVAGGYKKLRMDIQCEVKSVYEAKEKFKKEILLIRYYNVLFYLVFNGEIDDFNRQCLVNRINIGESIRMK